MNIVCIVSQSHLCRNPRVVKEATALANAGYDVCIITGSISAALQAEDELLLSNYPGISLKLVSNLSASTLSSFTDRLFAKLGRSLIKHFGRETPLALGYGAHRYYRACKAVKAGLYICHQELPTYLGTRLMAAGFKVAYDLEDWYSEDLLPRARAERPMGLLRKAEKTALTCGAFCTTTSHVLAAKLSEAYSSPKPAVIYNVFPSRPNLTAVAKSFTGILKLFWFSQTIGPGRGLEQFLSLAAKLKSPFEIHLLGNTNAVYRNHLHSLAPADHPLYFHKLVAGPKLANKIAEFDIGLALELDTPPSRNYTITNKFFQYIQAGLPVIASATEGQNEGFEQFNPGFKIAQQPTDVQIMELDKWLSQPAALQQARNRAVDAANLYNWEHEEAKLLTLVKQAFER
jgi:glycosyltransferase involved in cell wall biosynthesis